MKKVFAFVLAHKFWKNLALQVKSENAHGYPWAFLIGSAGIPETYEQIRVKRSPLFYLRILKTVGLGLATKTITKKYERILLFGCPKRKKGTYRKGRIVISKS